MNLDGRLDGASIYSILKGFFAKVGQRGDLVHNQAAFERARTHRMRHTFAHLGMAKGGDKSLATVQALLGHSSIATAGLYLKAQMGDRVRMIEAIGGSSELSRAPRLRRGRWLRFGRSRHARGSSKRRSAAAILWDVAKRAGAAADPDEPLHITPK